LITICIAISIFDLAIDGKQEARSQLVAGSALQPLISIALQVLSMSQAAWQAARFMLSPAFFAVEVGSPRALQLQRNS
jgi:hypothetical protein